MLMKGWVTLIFGTIVGGAGGFVAGAKIVQHKLNKKHEEEISSVKKTFESFYKTHEEESTALKTPEKTVEKPVFVQKSSIDEGKKIEKKTVDYNNKYVAPEVAAQMVKDEIHERLRDKSKPYIISEQEFADSDYKVKTLWVSDDGKISDDDGLLVEDVDILIGDALVHFDKSTGESLYVRNDDYKTDYEIMYNEGLYTSTYSTDHYIIGNNGAESGEE